MIHPVIGHFLEFGPSDQLDIAYFDSAKWYSRFVNGITHVLHLDHSIITLRWCKTTCFDQFLAIFSSLVCWIDLILHIMIVLNDFQLSIMLPVREGSFKNHKNAFLNDPKCQKRGFWSFS